jgi:hypothetical protein
MKKLNLLDVINHKKKIYYFIMNEMKKNLKNKIQIEQWFLDVTYYAIPRKNNSFKL